MTWQRELQKTIARLAPRQNQVARLANRYGSDKGTRWFDAHNYARIYEPLFRPLKDSPIRLLEIGLLNSRHYRSWSRRDERYAGTASGRRAPSLEMWSDYFPNATIVGFDINDFSGVRLPRCQIVRGDMGSRADLAKVAALGPFDIVIDDASHASDHQQIALGFLFAHVAAGGMYVIEDLTWQPGIEPDGAIKTRDVLRRAAVMQCYQSPFMADAERAVLDRETASIRLYDSQAKVGALDTDDALAIITKR